MSVAIVSGMNWYGTVEEGWKNKKTGQVIKFEESGGEVEIWLYKSSDRVRGQRVSKTVVLSEAIEEGKEIAMRYDVEGPELE